MATTAGISYIVGNTKYPTYIRNHPVFTHLSSIKKIFPHVGLPNLVEDCMVNALLEAQQVATQLIYSDIRVAVYHKRTAFHKHELRTLFDAIYNEIGSYYNHMIQGEGERVSLKFYHDCGIYQGKTFARQGESLFKVYNKLSQLAVEAGVSALPELEAMPNFKTFSSVNVPKKTFKLHFSSDGEQGAWDIATMSMRGINSCQSWDTPQSYGLIGSITSKYVGVIYVAASEVVPGKQSVTTDGESSTFNVPDTFGTKMMRRAVVRYCLHKETKQPALLIDRIYPNDNQAIKDVFSSFLTKHSKLEVIFPDNPKWSQYLLPTDHFWSQIPFRDAEYTYMDTKIAYKRSPLKDWKSYSQNIDRLDAELRSKVQVSILKKLDEYCANKEVHSEIFKGGVANLLVSMNTHIGSNCIAGKIASIRNMVQPGSHEQHLFPNYNLSETSQVYEREVIRAAIRQRKLFHDYISKNLQQHKWLSFYPKSTPKLTDLIVAEIKQVLLARYRQLLA